MNEFLSLTEIGKIYGVTSHEVGKWLKNLGLRKPDGLPSREARNGGYVAERPCPQPQFTYFVWHAEKTLTLLDGMCYPRAAS